MVMLLSTGEKILISTITLFTTKDLANYYRQTQPLVDSVQLMRLGHILNKKKPASEKSLNTR